MTSFIQTLKLDISMVKRVLIGLFVFLVLFFFILLMRHTFALQESVNSMSIESVKSSYKNNVGGSFVVNEKTKWISKDEALVSFEIDSKSYENSTNKDVILVINDSNFVSKESYNKLKDALKVNVKNMLSDNNRVALVTYNEKATIISQFSDNYDNLIMNINRISINKGTNYYDALCKVDDLLATKKDKHDVRVIMIFNSYPTMNSPLEVSQYKYLKENYKEISVFGIQYDLGENIINKVKNVTDERYISTSDDIEKVLDNSSKTPRSYDLFRLEETIDEEYFTISEDAKSEIGDIDTEGNRIVWNINDKLVSGFSTKMNFKIKLKEEYKNIDGLFKVNKKIKIKSKIDKNVEKIDSEKTPMIKNTFDVIYEPNAPTGCVLKNVPKSKSYSIFDVVEVSQNELECKGYNFNGWEIVNKVEKVNDDYFIMGEENVLIRGTWSKIKVSLSMEGSIHKSLSVHELLKSNEVKNSYSDGVHSINKTSKNPIYYYKGKANNNLIFAGYCWNIVRTTETGGVKIIYNGKAINNKCVNDSKDILMTNTSFNKNSNSLADLSYMYGTRITLNKYKNDKYKYGKKIIYKNGYYELIDVKDEISTDYRYTCLNNSNICKKVFYVSSYDDNNLYFLTLNGEDSIDELLDSAFASENNSNIKSYIDNWYRYRIIKYASYLEDTVYCNDRSLDSNFEFETYNRVKSKNVSLKCNKKDSFSVSTTIGNGALTYPIGMLSVDEYILSSGSIDNGEKFYLMSPYRYSGSSYVYVNTNSELVSNNNYFVRPVVSLKGKIKVVDGIGTKEKPYIIRLI